MQKRFLPAIFLLLSLSSFSQQSLPAYPEVVKSFFQQYNTSTDYENWIVFAKKKDGWYAQHVNRLKNDKTVDEQLFWSLSGGQYLQLTAPFDRTEDERSDEKMESFLADASYRWYDYERCRYFGYDGWAADIIKDYEGKPLDNDTLYESLARAYSSTALSYLWYQGGGAEDNRDPLKKKLERLERPVAARIEKVNYYIGLAIGTYALLEKRNPAYQVLVGNIALKKINEQVYGYDQMMMAGYTEAAKKFITDIVEEEDHIRQAKNYLNSCKPGAILFTYGDNDTYPLWYVQEKYNFRKDVTVINNSLLGVPMYVKMLRDKKMVSFSMPDAYLADEGADYSGYQKPAKEITPVSFNKFMADIYAKKLSSKNTVTPDRQVKNANYAAKKIIHTVKAADFPELKGFATGPYKVTLNNYLLISDLLIFDIIASNTTNRPIYFTLSGNDYFTDYLVTEGIAKRLLPLTELSKKQYATTEEKNLEKFVTTMHLPATVNQSKGRPELSADGNNSFVAMYSQIINYYLNKSDLAKAKQWITKAETTAPGAFKEDSYNLYYWGFLNLSVGNSTQGKQQVEQYARFQYNRFAKPSALNAYMDKKTCLTTMRDLMNLLTRYQEKSLVIDELVRKLTDE
jgi:hypothetical protein